MSYKKNGPVLEDYIPVLALNALKFTGNTEDASDLVQDTLFKAFKFYEQFQQGTNLTGWLFVIMRNTFLNTCKKKSQMQGVVTRNEEIPAANLLFSADHNRATDNFLMEDIQKALGTLPDIYRAAFLRYVEGYRYQEISAEQDIPLATVKTRIHQARIHLRKRLDPHMDYIR